MEYSLNQLQSIFYKALTAKLEGAPQWIKDVNDEVLVLTEATMLLTAYEQAKQESESGGVSSVPTNNKDMVDVEHYLTVMRLKMELKIKEGCSKEWFEELDNLIQYYQNRWLQ